MNLDWSASSNEVMLNPRILKEERKRYAEILSERGSLKGHVWFATSGTKGHFKFAALSKEAMLVSAEAVNKHFSSDSTDVWINVLPTFHVGGAGIFARSYLSGAKVINLYSQASRWSPQRFIEVAEEKNATLASLVPTQVFDLVKSKFFAPKSLRAVIVGGAALDPALYKAGTSLGWKLYPTYGMTECSSQVATAKKEKSATFVPLNHVEIKIGEEKQIFLKSAALLTIYGIVKEKEIDFYDPKTDGWLKTGDRGALEEGVLKVFGRERDFIKVGGESVNLKDIQQKIDTLRVEMGVEEDLFIISKEDLRLGYVVGLLVQEKSSVKVDALVRVYNENALPFARIATVEVVEKICRTELGKPRI